MQLDNFTLDIEQHIEIHAPIGDVFKGVLHRFGEGNTTPNGDSLQMILEQWPGGRWFRDRGNGIGHLWGHLQVIKPPVLIELSGPMFMSYPALNHIEVKLIEIAGGVKVSIRHRGIGLFDPELRKGVGIGWRHYLDVLANDFARTPAGRV